MYDGSTIFDTMLATLTGDVLPADVTSTGTFVLINFASDGSETRAGFRIHYDSGKVRLGIVK